MMNAMRIAHISDLHLSALHKRVNIRNTKRLLDYIRHQRVDHVVLTGDIVANAEKAEFALARKILDAHGLLDPGRASVVIGNHDVFGGVHFAEEIFSFPRRCRETKYERMVGEFREQFHELFEGCDFASEEDPFPYVKSLGDLLLIGINSVAEFSLVRNPVGSNGAVDDLQLQKLDRLLSSLRTPHAHRVLLIHHHFDKFRQKADGTMHGVWRTFENQTTKLRRKKEIMKFLRKHGVRTVLHGHLHESMEYIRKGIRFFNAGGSILGPDPDVLQVNIVQFSPAGVSAHRHVIPAPDLDRQGEVLRARAGDLASHRAA